MTDFNRTNKLLDYDPAKFVCGSVVGSVGRKIEGHRFFDRLKPEGSRNSEPRIVSAAAHGGSSSFDGRKRITSPISFQTT
jgi:hypothetical protein